MPAKELLARQDNGRGRCVPPTAEAEIRGGEHCFGTSRGRDISSGNHETAITTLITYGNNQVGNACAVGESLPYIGPKWDILLPWTHLEQDIRRFGRLTRFSPGRSILAPLVLAPP